jgi:hypothetical protein
LCGHEQLDRLLSETLPGPEAALCSPRCTAAWHALVAVRGAEAASEIVATRRRLELETGGLPTTTLSQLLLTQWRAGDWSVVPEDILAQMQVRPRPTLAARVVPPPAR